MADVRLKNTLVVCVALALSALGAYNLILKASTSPQDDGVFWKDEAQGVVAGRVTPGGPGARAGIVPGDVLLALDGETVLSGTRVEELIARRTDRAPLRYSLLRVAERRVLDVALRPLEQGNVRLFFYLSLVGFSSLLMGTLVLLKRPADRTTVHFYAICLLFFLMYSTSYTGRLDTADWALFWIDHLAILFLPIAFLHFAVTFPERPQPGWRRTLLAFLYLPAAAFAVAALVAYGLTVTGQVGLALWPIAEAIDGAETLYFATLFVLAFGVFLDSYRRSTHLLVRRQLKWLVWGTGAGILPFLAFYALPSALGEEPRLAMELAGYIPLALIPLSLAYAVVRHRLMDVDLIFRRTLVFLVAAAAILGISLLVVGLMQSLMGEGEEPHTTSIAFLTATVVLLLFTPIKARIQEGMERLVYRHRYAARKALRRLSQELNADLDLSLVAERLLRGVEAGIGLQSVAVLLPAEDGGFAALGCRGRLGQEGARIPPGSRLLARLTDGRPVHVESLTEDFPEVAALNLAHYFPCRAGGELVAILATGRKDGFLPLNSEEADVLETLAAQAATAFMNARLYRRLEEKAVELEAVTEYNVNILESVDTGILVLDLEGQISRWNRAMESLLGRTRQDALGRSLDEVFPVAFLEALRSSLVVGDAIEISHIYKLHLPAPNGHSLMVNVSVAPFQAGSGARQGTVLILENVTTRVHLEEQLQHSEKMASIGLLAAGVAHEVNTPLAGISSYTQMLKARLDPGDGRAQLLEKIETQSFRAAKIVHNLLNFARSSGAEMETLDLNKLIQDVLSLVEHQLEGAKIRTRLELGDGLPPVRGNENRLQQVFFNLVLNARDAMPSGGWLSIRTWVEDDTVIAEVGDTGVGIKREDIKRIYDPFFTTKGIGRGTGLGLSVSYGILQDHGGAIFVDSTPGQGTRFQVALPALAVREAARR
jgi:two-component system NtrC family sensor kinase